MLSPSARRRGASAHRATAERLEGRALLSVSLVADLNTLPVPAGGSVVVLGNGLAFYAHDDSEHGLELWRTDGTPAGTGLVKDVRPGIAGSDPDLLGGVGGRLFFVVDDGAGDQRVSESSRRGQRSRCGRLPLRRPSRFRVASPARGTAYASCASTRGCDRVRLRRPPAGTP